MLRQHSFVAFWFVAIVFWFVAIVLLVGHAGIASAEQFFDPATGHWYEPMLAPGGINWGDAEAAAEAQGGYLATIGSAAENQFVFSLIDTAPYWTGPPVFGTSLGPWLGGYSNAPSDTWNWVTGAAFSYTDWYPGPPYAQPDGYGGPNQAVQYYAYASIGPTWGDDPSDGTSGYALANGYVIEFNAVPQPGDANGDGRVDINDLTIVLANYADRYCTWSQGCMDGDPLGIVDINDLSIVLANFGYGVTAAAGVKAVPEPSAIALLLAAAACLIGFGWRLPLPGIVFRSGKPLLSGSGSDHGGEVTGVRAVYRPSGARGTSTEQE